MGEVSGIFPSLREESNDLGPLPLRTSRNDGGGRRAHGTQKPDPREPGALKKSPNSPGSRGSGSHLCRY